jgi:hypothetical protein
MPWLGRKKLAFIPLSRTNIQPPDIIPTDWSDQIMQRVFFDPAKDPVTGNPITGTDRSVRAYFHTVSSGLADLDVVVLPPQTIAEKDVPPAALEATMGNQLRSEGFVGAAIVMLGGPGGGSTAQLSNFAWSRFCMSDNLGNWVGEIMHQTNLCDLPDLFDFAGQYPSGANMGPFEQEAGYLATHPCAWTKRAVGWLDPSAIPTHPGLVADYTLHSISLIQPPPTGRIAAVQIGPQVPYLMVEARQRADQFDINIPNEGVIVYRVQTTDPLGNAQNDTAPLALLTKIALTVGQSFTSDTGVTVQVGSSVPGGFSITVNDPIAPALVPDVYHVFQNQASTIVSEAGFVPKFSIPQEYENYPPSSRWVSSQDPTGNTLVAYGSTVAMELTGQNIVPDVYEMHQNQAFTIISEAGFVSKFSIPQKYQNYPASSLWVTSQDPAASTMATLASTVTMELTGEKIL